MELFLKAYKLNLKKNVVQFLVGITIYSRVIEFNNTMKICPEFTLEKFRTYYNYKFC